ncbi:MAG: MBL-fold metallo-hydrolase superfamily, partial [uncultured Sphingomonas sp.]
GLRASSRLGLLRPDRSRPVVHAGARGLQASVRGGHQAQRRADRLGRAALRGRHRDRSRPHNDRRARSHARHGDVPRPFRARPAAAHGRLGLPPDHQHRPTLAPGTGSRQGHGARLAPKGLRQGSRRPAPRSRVPPSVPRPRPHPQDRHRLCLGAGPVAVL